MCVYACQNNVVVHYSCLNIKEKHICPVTGINFLEAYNDHIANGGDGVHVHKLIDEAIDEIDEDDL